jgi:RNA polymerase sigma-70 factor, ECF subfamily
MSTQPYDPPETLAVDYSTMTVEKLLGACGHTQNAEAWGEFIRRSHRLIAIVAQRTARRWGERSNQALDDLIQETYLKLCANAPQLLRMSHSTSEAAFYGYIKVLTVNLVHDHFRAERTLRRGSDMQRAPTPEVGENGIRDTPNRGSGSNEGERTILLREIDMCLRAIAPGPNANRDRRVFWLYYRVGLSARAIAELPAVGLTTKGIESILRRMTQYVRDQFVSDSRRNVGTLVLGSSFPMTPSQRCPGPAIKF